MLRGLIYQISQAWIMTITRDVEGQVYLTLVKPETLVKHCKANTKHTKALFSLSELPLNIQS